MIDPLDDYEAPTKIYTFDVRMIIEVVDKTEEQAREKLDLEGGFVSDRVKTLINVIEIPQPKIRDE